MNEKKTSDIVVSQINKRIDNQEARINRRLDCFDGKLDSQHDKLASMDNKLDKNTEILDQHIRRTELNEIQIHEFRKFQESAKLDAVALSHQLDLFKSKITNRIYGATAVFSAVSVLISLAKYFNP